MFRVLKTTSALCSLLIRAWAINKPRPSLLPCHLGLTKWQSCRWATPTPPSTRSAPSRPRFYSEQHCAHDPFQPRLVMYHSSGQWGVREVSGCSFRKASPGGLTQFVPFGLLFSPVFQPKMLARAPWVTLQIYRWGSQLKSLWSWTRVSL